VVVEVIEKNGLIILFPISAHRISHKGFIRRMRQQEEQACSSQANPDS
jgi:hypothetical protein